MLVHMDNHKFTKKPSRFDIAGIKERLANPNNIQDLTTTDIANCLTQGQTIQPGVTPLSEKSRQNGKKGTCADDFKSISLFMIDIDNACPGIAFETPIHVEEVLNTYCIPVAFAYHTFTSTAEHEKFRFAIVCDEAVTDDAERKRIFLALLKCFPQADQSCKNADRIFFGTDKGLCDGVGNINATVTKAALMSFVERMLPSDLDKHLIPFQQKPSGTILIGQRHNTLLTFAVAKLKRYGICEKAHSLYIQKVLMCQEPLPDKEIEKIWDDACYYYRKNIVVAPSYIPPDHFSGTAKVESRPNVPSFIVTNRNGEQVSSPLLAEYYLKEHKIIIVVDGGTPQVYEYVDGAYQFRNRLAITSTLGKYLKNYNAALWTDNKVGEAYKYIIQESGLFVQQAKINLPDMVCLKNGLLSIEEWKLYPHNPNDVYTMQLDIDFSQEMLETPIFDKTLLDFCDRDDKKVQFLMQWLGAIFSNVPGYKFKKYLLTIGPTNSGKTLMKRLTESIIGNDLCNHCDLSDLESNRFSTSGLYQKRLAGTNDLGTEKIRGTSRIKQLTGGDSIQAEFKGENSFGFVFSGYLWFVGNTMPQYSGDVDDAFCQREIMFEVNRSIPSDEIDADMLEKLLLEKQGIVLKCLHAARKAIYDNHYRFDVPPMCLRHKNYTKIMEDCIKNFLDECTCTLTFQGLSQEEANKHTATNIYKAFQGWLKTHDKSCFCSQARKALFDFFEVDENTVKTQRIDGVSGRFLPVMLTPAGEKYNDNSKTTMQDTLM